MRQIDKYKNSMQKVAKTISFDKVVLQALEKRAKESSSTSSRIINMLVRRHILTDPEFYKEMAKEAYLEMQKYRFLKEECIAIVETKTN